MKATSGTLLQCNAKTDAIQGFASLPTIRGKIRHETTKIAVQRGFNPRSVSFPNVLPASMANPSSLAILSSSSQTPRSIGTAVFEEETRVIGELSCTSTTKMVLAACQNRRPDHSASRAERTLLPTGFTSWSYGLLALTIGEQVLWRSDASSGHIFTLLMKAKVEQCRG